MHAEGNAQRQRAWLVSSLPERLTRSAALSATRFFTSFTADGAPDIMKAPSQKAAGQALMAKQVLLPRSVMAPTTFTVAQVSPSADCKREIMFQLVRGGFAPARAVG